MARYIFKTGVDVHVRRDVPKAAKPDAPYPALGNATNAERYIYLRFSDAAEVLRGETVLSAEFTGRVRDTGNSHAVTISALTGPLKVRQTTWNDKPGVSPAGQTTTTLPFTADNARWATPIDVTTLAQQIADFGHYGFRLTTDANQTRQFYGFDTGENAWRMVVITSDLPDAPSSLEPAGGSVGLAQPTFTWQVDDPDPDDGQPSAQIAYRVQIDTPAEGADPDGTTPDVDLTVNSTVGEHPMAGGSYSLAQGQAAFWRVKTRGTSQGWSEWSDWAEIAYYPYPTVEITSPAGTVLYDKSPQVEVTVGGSTPPEGFRWLVRDPDADRYDSGWEGVPDGSGQTVGWSIPFRSDTLPGVVLPQSGPYSLISRVQDRDDRVASPGDPGYVQVVKEVTVSDLGNPAPRLLSVDQAGERLPFADLRFSADAAPDAWEVIRDGVSVADVPHAEVKRIGPGVWGWRDKSVKPGEHEYVLRALTLNGGTRVRSKPSAPQRVTLVVTGLWLVRSNNDAVRLAGDVGDIAQAWSTASYQPLRGPRVDVIYDFLGLVGTFSGYLHLRHCDDAADFEKQLATLRTMQKNPTETMQLVYAEASVPVQLAQLSIVAAPGDDGGRYTAESRSRRVSFELWQVDDFDAEV